MRNLLVLAAALSLACGRGAATPQGPQDAWWASMRSLCGQAYEGRMVEGNPTDTAFANARLVMHVRECSDTVIKVPFHLGEDRSRTWVFTRTADGLRLKHDHRHEDGSEDRVTQYGGDTPDAGTETLQEFHADAHTAALIPYAATNIWSFEVMPEHHASYRLRREGRRFRVDFDLTRTVEPPPAPWGHQ